MSWILLLLYSLPPVRSVVCMQCGGEAYGGGLSVWRAACCRPTPKVCAPGLACLRAVVNNPEMQFILSGCHPPEDGLIGCDTHQLPFNATIQRCVCLDKRCQEYFPGTCPTRASPTEYSTTIKPSTFEDLIYNRSSEDSYEEQDKSEEQIDAEHLQRIKLRAWSNIESGEFCSHSIILFILLIMC